MNHCDPNLEQLVCFNFYLGWRSIQAYYKDCLSDGMTAQRMYVLALCDQERPITVSEVAHALTIDLPAVSGLLDRMEKDGLIQRRRVPDNRRTVHVTLTEQGAKVRAEHNERLHRADEELVAGEVKYDDILALQRLVRGITSAVHDKQNERADGAEASAQKAASEAAQSAGG
jgi:DNA-binding MarR family transcriptional regulator